MSDTSPHHRWTIWLAWVAVVVGLLAAACGGPDEPSGSPGHDPDPGPEELEVDWGDPARLVDFEDGWTIAGCIGDGLFLCVERDGAPVGTVEAVNFPIESFDFIDPTGSPTTQLRGLADAFLTTFRTDREAGCGSDYGFDPVPDVEMPLGGTPGLAFGFAGALPDGRPSELILRYAAIVEDRILLLVANADNEHGCLGRDHLSGFTTDDLEEFRPHLEEVLRVSPLPDLGP